MLEQQVIVNNNYVKSYCWRKARSGFLHKFARFEHSFQKFQIFCAVYWGFKNVIINCSETAHVVTM
jgi:hypothetical protein